MLVCNCKIANFPYNAATANLRNILTQMAHYTAVVADCTELYTPSIEEIEEYDEHDELRKLLHAVDNQNQDGEASGTGIQLHNVTAAGGAYLDTQGIWHIFREAQNLTGYDPMA